MHPAATLHESEPHAPFDDAARVGRRRFIVGAGALAGATTVGMLAVPGFAQAEAPEGASQFFPLSKAYRAADTRPGKPEKSYTTIDDRQIRIRIAGVPHPGSTSANPIEGVPADATAVVLNLTGIRNGAPNNIRVFPTGPVFPDVSNVNVAPSATSANMATVKLGGGSVDVAARFACDMVVDVLGYYRPVSGPVAAGRYVSLAAPKRAYDQSVGGERFTTVDLTGQVPEGASSVVLNLTVAQAGGGGWFAAVAHDIGDRPTTSNLNVMQRGDTRAGAAVVAVETVGGRRRIKIYSVPSATRLIVDVFGYYTDSTAPPATFGLFVALDPLRIRDTRKDVPAPVTQANGFQPPAPDQPVGRLWPNWVVEAPLPAAISGQAAAVVANVTAVEPRTDRGHLRIAAARQPVPETSNLNWVGPFAVPNHVISTATSRGIQAYTPHGCHVVVDLAGYFIGGPQATASTSGSNPPPPPARPEWILRVPDARGPELPNGLTSRVLTGDGSIVDLGHSWHWRGTGFAGEAADVAVFAHRTSAGGPYRYVDRIGPGSTATLTTGDGREYTYRYVGRSITDESVENITEATRRFSVIERDVRTSPPTLSLIACTVGYDSTKAAYPDPWAPTSLLYRIVVTLELESWRLL